MNGLELWNAVEKTDPKYTKEITGKKFRGDAVNNVHVAKKLTTVLGPAGVRWGWNVLDERIQEFGRHEDKSHTVIHWLRVALWIKGEDGKKETFENFGTTIMASYTKNGYTTDDDAPKKSMTDALSKLMLYLGGSADVWLNEFDPHNKYVAPKTDRRTEQPLVTHEQVRSAEADDRGQPTFLLDGVRLTGEDWIAAAVLTAKRLQPSALLVWWEKAKPERARMHVLRPDLGERLDKISAGVKRKGETFNGTSEQAAEVRP
jgi:hypothetical protein